MSPCLTGKLALPIFIAFYHIKTSVSDDNKPIITSCMLTSPQNTTRTRLSMLSWKSLNPLVELNFKRLCFRKACNVMLDMSFTIGEVLTYYPFLYSQETPWYKAIHHLIPIIATAQDYSTDSLIKTVWPHQRTGLLSWSMMVNGHCQHRHLQVKKKNTLEQSTNNASYFLMISSNCF